MKIKFREEADLKALNAKLAEWGVKNRIIEEEDNIAWLKDINENPESPQLHLKPLDRDLTMEELKSYLGMFMEVGVLDVDIHFGRTPVETMKVLALFIYDNQEQIEFITESEILIERGEITAGWLVKGLRKMQRVDEPLELLPEEEYLAQKELQGGQLLCKSWSPNPFWVICQLLHNLKVGSLLHK